jgi:hypothetical protein
MTSRNSLSKEIWVSGGIPAPNELLLRIARNKIGFFFRISAAVVSGGNGTAGKWGDISFTKRLNSLSASSAEIILFKFWSMSE